MPNIMDAATSTSTSTPATTTTTTSTTTSASTPPVVVVVTAPATVLRSSTIIDDNSSDTASIQPLTPPLLYPTNVTAGLSPNTHTSTMPSPILIDDRDFWPENLSTRSNSVVSSMSSTSTANATGANLNTTNNSTISNSTIPSSNIISQLGFCYSCNRQYRINPIDFTCTVCHSGFIELFDGIEAP